MTSKKLILLVCALSTLNYFAALTFTGDFGLFVGRLILAIAVGYLAVSKCNDEVGVALLYGALIVVIDKIVLDGGLFLILNSSLSDTEAATQMQGLSFGAYIFAAIIPASIFAGISAITGVLSGKFAKAC
jgi:hypothetical protein